MSDLVYAVAAIKNDRFDLAQSMLARHPHMYFADSDFFDNIIKQENPYFNHFYYVSSTKEECESQVGVVIQDNADLRQIARKLEVDAYIYWGSNGDPVSYATFAKVVQLMTSEKKPASWGSAAWKPPTMVAKLLNGRQVAHARMFND